MVLEEWRKVLACEIVVNLDEKEKCLSKQWQGSVRGKGLTSRGGEKGVDVLEQLVVGLGEALQNKVDLSEELVCAELGAPSGSVSG